MGNPLPWALLHRRLLEIEGQRIMENMKHVKQHKVTVSNTPPCSVCGDSTPNNMRNQVVSCASIVCAAACVPPLNCEWRCKVLTCKNTGLKNIYELGSHVVMGEDPPSGKLTIEQTKLSRQLAANGMKPARIRNALADGTPVDKIPHLNKVQNFVTHFRKKEMDNTDDLDGLELVIKEKAFTGQEEDTDAFAFLCNGELEGEIVVGEGTNNDAFLVGFTTKTLLKRLDRDPQSFIFHFDTTCKLNQVDYPTFVCGVSDHACGFHLVALFVASQQEERHCTSALASLRSIYARVQAKPLQVHYILGDADGAQYKAMSSVFKDCEPEILMCFYHVIAKVHERSRSISKTVQSQPT